MPEQFPIDACIDCLHYIDLGKLPDDRPHLPNLIADMWDDGTPFSHTFQSDHWNWDGPEFSWQPCECCGSKLGGNRFRLVVTVKENDND